jgi:D-glycero-D-manno-heptose 1,7-bisphosphate phosphatase
MTLSRPRGPTAVPGQDRAAVFLDRDGTVCEEVGYVNHVSRCALLPRSAEAIRLLNQADLPVIIVTNQAGVARGYFDEAMILAVHERLRGLLAKEGARVLGIYYCPHHPSAGEPPYRAECDCRTPKAGLLRRAADEHALDLSRSFMAGDSSRDVLAAAAAGATPVLVLTGYGRGEWEHQRARFTVQPAHVAEDLLGAARWILARRERSE